VAQHDAYKEKIAQGLSWMKIEAGEGKLALLSELCELIENRNRRVNLISRRSEPQTHVLDSAALLTCWPDLPGREVVDVGSGGGFPGLVLKILKPELVVTLLEPQRKKHLFLINAAETLGLDGVEVVRERAEGITGRRFSLATARALAAVPKVMRVCSPLIEPGGYLAIYRTRPVLDDAGFEGEMKNGGYATWEGQHVSLPKGTRDKHLLLVRKI
jgi:16S rRNA (guanine527-N7)-methyltransferase